MSFVKEVSMVRGRDWEGGRRGRLERQDRVRRIRGVSLDRAWGVG